MECGLLKRNVHFSNREYPCIFESRIRMEIEKINLEGINYFKLFSQE